MLPQNSAFFSFLFAICLLCAAIAADPVSAQSAQGQISWEQLNRELAEKPDDAKLWLLKGQILAKSFEDTEAIEAFTKAIKLDPHLAQAYICRGDAYMTYEKPMDALSNYLKAQALLKNTPGAPEYFRVQVAIAQCYKLRKQYAEELPMRISIVKHTKSANDFASLAGCQMQNKLFKEASISYQNAIKKNPSQIDLHRQYGEYFFNLGDYENAAQEFTRAIDLVIREHALDISGNHHLYERRAECYEKLGHTALAVQDRRRAQKWQESIFDASPIQDARNR